MNGFVKNKIFSHFAENKNIIIKALAIKEWRTFLAANQRN